MAAPHQPRALATGPARGASRTRVMRGGKMQGSEPDKKSEAGYSGGNEVRPPVF